MKNNQKRTSTQVTADNLRKRAAALQQQANQLLQTANKLEKEGKTDVASATRLHSAETLKLAESLIAEADALNPKVEVPSVEETEVAEETVEEASVEEAEDAEETAKEAPAEEAEDAEETAQEAPVEEADEAEETAEEAPKKPVRERAKEFWNNKVKGKQSVKKAIMIGTIAALLFALILMIASVASRGTESPVPDVEDTAVSDTPTTPDEPTTDEPTTDEPTTDEPTTDEPTTDEPTTDEPTTDEPTTDEPTNPDEPEQPELVMSQFKSSVTNIAETLNDDEDISANVDVFVENIGEDKLVELIEKYGELNVQKAIAEFLAFVPEVKMQQYIANEGLDYNPNADSDYYAKLQELKNAYVDATGKNPDGVVMSLEGYEINKSNRKAIEAMIIETGDIALLEWYQAKNEALDLRVKQNQDTQVAENYKQEVKLQLVTNVKGATNLLELQLEQEVVGNLAVMDTTSMQYTDAYSTFIFGNYFYVLAN